MAEATEKVRERLGIALISTVGLRRHADARSPGRGRGLGIALISTVGLRLLVVDLARVVDLLLGTALISTVGLRLSQPETLPHDLPLSELP